MLSLKFTESKSFQNRFGFIRDLLIIIGVFFAGGSMIYAGMQVTNSRKVTSAQFAMNISKTLNDNKYDNITSAIEGDDTPHTSTYPILKSSGGQFKGSDIDDYIGKYDDVAMLWQDGLVDEKIAYNEFSYDAEKAWCNNDIQNYIMIERKADKNFVGFKAFYSDFETMSKRFLTIDGKTCSDMDKE